MEKEEYRKIIKEATKQAYNDDPCNHCGPGNGCDDCRGCKNREISRQIWKPINQLKDDYKKKFGVSIEFDDDLDIVKENEKKWKKLSDHCRNCGGDFGDDCIDCKEWDEIVKCSNSYKFWKNNMKSKYNYDYDKNKIGTKKSNAEIISKDMEIITAEQAKKLLEKEIEDDKQCLVPIMESIQHAIKQKKNHVYVASGVMPDYAIDKLKNLGYKVQLEKGDYREPDMYEVKW